MKKDTTHKDESEQEIALEFDFSKIKSVFKGFTFSKVWLTVILIVLLAAFTLFIRMQPMNLNVTDGWAQNSVQEFYRQNVANQINAQYPNLPAENKNALINKNLADLMEQNRDRIDLEVQQMSDSFKTRMRYEASGDTQTYLGDLDSYYYLRQARNIINTGTACDTFVEGKCWDSHLLAPNGASTTLFMHPYGIAAIYPLVKSFSASSDEDLLLMRSSFLVPVLLAILTSIFAFLLARKVSGNLGGFLAGILVAVSPLFVTRTAGSDTDIWNVFFPVFIVYLFFEAMTAKKFSTKMILTGVTGLAMGVFSFAWGGWWYLFDFLLASLIGYIGYIAIRYAVAKKNILLIFKDKTVKSTLLMTGVYIVSSALFVTLFSSFRVFMNFILGVSGFVDIKIATKATLWPNIYTTVAELNEANLSTIIGQVGGPILFTLALIGTIFWFLKKFDFSMRDYGIFFGSVILFYLLANSLTGASPFLYFILLFIPFILVLFTYIRKDKYQDDTLIKFSLLLTIWFVGTMFASLKGVRFVLLLTPIIGISIGIVLATLYHKIKIALKKHLNFEGVIVSIILLIVVVLMMIGPVRTGYVASSGFTPSISDAWVETLNKIEVDSQPDAIINSWWDFGHWFKYWADRSVSLDGVTQNNPQAQWLGKMIQSPSEAETLGIMRMLDCGSNNAFDEVNKKYDDTEYSVALLREIILLDKADAGVVLEEKGFTDNEINSILEYSHCNPPENYFITSGDMVGKAGVWGHFGLWDFSRAWMASNVRDKSVSEAISMMTDRYDYDEDTARSLFFELQSLQSEPEVNAWIAPWPGFVTNTNNCEEGFDNATEQDFVRCEYRVSIGNQANQQVVLESVYVYPDALNESYGQIGAYDANTGTRLGGDKITFSRIYYGLRNNTELAYEDFESPGIPYAIVVSKQSEGEYISLMADPLLVTSTFAKLYYLDGSHTSKFEKFSDLSTVYGNRIIVWKVQW